MASRQSLSVLDNSQREDLCLLITLDVLYPQIQQEGEKMMKALVFLVSVILSAASFSDNHVPDKPYLGFYYFSAPNADAVVAAMDKFYASDCGKRYPANVALAEQVFNGGYESTHFFLNAYPSAEAQQAAAEIFRSCSAALEFLSELESAGVQPTMEHLSFPLIDEGDSSRDFAFAKFDVRVEPQNQTAYAMAFSKMMMQASKDIALRSYGNNLAVFGNDRFTNSVYIGAESLAQLEAIQRALFAHPAYAEFSRETANIREGINTSQVLFLKNYPMQ